MQIVVLEDTPADATDLIKYLRQEFPGTTIRWLKSEQEFRGAFESIASNPPLLIIIDVMLRWTQPQSNMPAVPEDVREQGGHIRAGFRCQQALAQDSRTKGIPVILYTVLDRDYLKNELEGIGNGVIHMQKSSDCSQLGRMIRSLVPEALPEHAEQVDLLGETGDEFKGPLGILKKAIQAVPAVRYALGITGLAAALAIILILVKDPRVALLGVVIMLVLMVALLAFATLVSRGEDSLRTPAIVLMWAFLILTVLTPFLLLSSLFFGVPLDLRPWILPH